MSADKKIKVVMAKIWLDGHERGIKIVVFALREAGMEVVYLGLHQTPETVVQAAIQEDADVIGISSLGGDHLEFVPVIMKLLKENNAEDILLIIGGIFPREDIPVLKGYGVSEVFMGTQTKPVTEYIKENVKGK